MPLKFAILTNVVSPHMVPLARRIAKFTGNDGFRYIAMRGMTAERRNLGWSDDENCPWIASSESLPLAEDAEVLLTDIRDFDLIERRVKGGLTTVYESERWFKPIDVLKNVSGKRHFYLPGWLRLLHPGYFKMAKRIAALIGGDNAFCYFAKGPWAMRDMKLVCGLFRVPRQKRDAKMRLWGYFVEPSMLRPIVREPQDNDRLRVLWIGRMVYWKRADTLIQAVASLDGVDLDIYGTGPIEGLWKRIAKEAVGKTNSRISFYGQVPVEKVREIMRGHDVVVLTSNQEEGWGAVVNEAMSEGVAVAGTYEAGSSSSIIDGENGVLFHSGNVGELRGALIALKDRRFRDAVAKKGSESIRATWSPECAAEYLTERFCQ